LKCALQDDDDVVGASRDGDIGTCSDSSWQAGVAEAQAAIRQVEAKPTVVDKDAKLGLIGPTWTEEGIIVSPVQRRLVDLPKWMFLRTKDKYAEWKQARHRTKDEQLGARGGVPSTPQT